MFLSDVGHSLGELGSAALKFPIYPACGCAKYLRRRLPLILGTIGTPCQCILVLCQLASDNIQEEGTITGGPVLRLKWMNAKLRRENLITAIMSRAHGLQGAERTVERRLFAAMVEDRSAETLKGLLTGMCEEDLPYISTNVKIFWPR